MCLCEFSCSLLSFFMTLFWILHMVDHNLSWLWISSWKTVVFFLWFHVTVVFQDAQWVAPLSVNLKEQCSYVRKALYTLILTIRQIANRGPSAFFNSVTLWHKFLVCFTWAAPGYIWGTTFFAFHGLFQRHYHCPGHQCLCLQHHWWPGVVSVPDVAGIFAGCSQSGRCSCHMQGDFAWGPPPLMPGSLSLQVLLHPGSQGFAHHFEWDSQVLWGCGLSCLSHGLGSDHCLCCYPGSTSSMWKIHSPSGAQLCVSLVYRRVG